METEEGFLQFDENEMKPVYLAFREHLGKGVPNEHCYQKALHDLVPAYSGPLIYFDFSDDGRLLGIDIGPE